MPADRLIMTMVAVGMNEWMVIHTIGRAKEQAINSLVVVVFVGAAIEIATGQKSSVAAIEWKSRPATADFSLSPTIKGAFRLPVSFDSFASFPPNCPQWAWIIHPSITITTSHLI